MVLSKPCTPQYDSPVVRILFFERVMKYFFLELFLLSFGLFFPLKFSLRTSI